MTADNLAAENGQELIIEFVDEAIESLRGVPDQLEAFRLHPADDKPIHAVFRSVHSIKGCAGFLGLTSVKQFAHALENTMDEARKGKLILSESLQRSLVAGIDLLEAMLNRTLEGELDAPLTREEAELLAEVEREADACRPEGSAELDILQTLRSLAEEMTTSQIPMAATWAERCLRLVESSGGEDASQDANANGEGKSAPPAAPQACEFLKSTCSIEGSDVTDQLCNVLSLFMQSAEGGFRRELAEPFYAATEMFASWADEKSQASLAAALRQAATDLRTLVNSSLDIDMSLLSVVWDRLWPEFILFDGAPQPASAEKESDSGDKQAQGSTSQSTKNASPEKDSEDKSEAASKKTRLVRVKEERLDQFLNEVSRLFITNELLKDLHSRMSCERGMPALVEELRQINAAFNMQSSSLQKSVVALRRVAVSGLFSKFPRMARTLASQLNKKVDVRLLGEDTEIDKSLVEDLDAPLTHMIRNSIDHGFETPQERLTACKSESGTLTLGAEITRTHVVITINDDGRGIDPQRLRKKAVEKQILTAEQAQAMPDEEAVRLIFHAGFSTAEQLSEVSGRGVGMDVVRTNLLEHNGEIRVESVVGVGTTFRLEIPIREAVLVIDGLMLEQSGDPYVLPFEHIREITEIEEYDLKPVQGSRVATVRGRTVAAVSLGQILGLTQGLPEQTSEHRYQAVVVGCKYGEICLLVDRVRGHRQIVLNSLKDLLPETRKIAGVAQLGGGRLALVLSVEEIVRSLLNTSEAVPAQSRLKLAAPSLQPA